ncbi:MAG: TatD family hydrolase [Candidatus Binatus sp.]|uniref:TatD family hydrolase n=1 Tax=Candidatus Binatus sp. TaxID=2811406 RepID=UPI00271BF3EF|nr:TatD family hydrolase [Candidatus Binatus sp.]MDO8433986.1 TatD family hydrolase [Candidatus Binatus sp.]
MTTVIDTHCHLADAKFCGDVEAAIERAHEAGVAQIVTVGAIGAIENDRLTVEIAERHANVYAAVGVHPHDAKDCTRERIAALRELASSKTIVAIGESGLDFHYMHSPAEAQEASLRRHLELAAELELPIVIHCRDAEARIVEIVREVGMPRRGGVIHCFTGDTNAARDFVALGFHISFSGILTFKNARAIRAAAPTIPDDRVMVETDAPYLAPEPYRGQRNEPAYVMRTLEVLAQLRKVEVAAMGAQVIANASLLFGLGAFPENQ